MQLGLFFSNQQKRGHKLGSDGEGGEPLIIYCDGDVLNTNLEVLARAVG